MPWPSSAEPTRDERRHFRRNDATITAGSASPLSDGAAAIVIASKAAAEAAALTWIAEIGSHGQTAGPDASLHSQPRGQSQQPSNGRVSASRTWT
ncbi:hypothetical protein AB0323_00740 [Arthrobacter sp. NPDC080031]|uniref:thiolase family protein n=1 Tax=Arthrobacter sp. NPDC080031 TaxID=3155918 RepID=UPI00344E250A